MADTEKVVCLDKYWNYIATPLFLITLAFGIYVLFRASNTQLAPAATIASMVGQLRKGSPFAGKGGPLRPSAAANTSSTPPGGQGSGF